MFWKAKQFEYFDSRRSITSSDAMILAITSQHTSGLSPTPSFSIILNHSQSFSVDFKSSQAKIFEFCRGGSYAYNEQGPCVKSGSDSTYVFDNHNQEGQLDCQGLLGVERASDEVGADVRAHNFED